MPSIVARIRDDGELDLCWTRAVFASRAEALRERDQARLFFRDVALPLVEVYALHLQEGTMI